MAKTTDIRQDSGAADDASAGFGRVAADMLPAVDDGHLVTGLDEVVLDQGREGGFVIDGVDAGGGQAGMVPQLGDGPVCIVLRACNIPAHQR